MDVPAYVGTLKRGLASFRSKDAKLHLRCAIDLLTNQVRPCHTPAGGGGAPYSLTPVPLPAAGGGGWGG